MNIVEAITLIKNGKHVTRKEWYDGVYLFIENNTMMYVWPNKNVSPYYPTMTDILADDWIVL